MIKMRMTTNLVSVLFKVPKVQTKYLYYINSRTSHDLISRRHLRSPILRQTCCCKISIPSLTQIRKIRVTDPKRALNPILLLILRPLSKFITVITGRLIRKWWKRLTPEQKKVIWKKIRKRRSVIAAFGSFFLVIFTIYYYAHLVETPLTKRKRFIMISDDAMNKIGQLALWVQLEKYKREIVPLRHPFYQRTARVVNAIINANRDVPEFQKFSWDLKVIDRPDVTNACCIPNGTILVFTGILNVCTNDDQLAIVLSHEISHTILSHATENLSKTYLVEGLLLIPSFFCWVIFTDFWALLSDGITEMLAKFLVHLPFNRALEREADAVGLFLAARACFDVREAPLLWSKIGRMEASQSQVEWLSTHPASETREEDMKKMLPIALQLRSASNCPSLRNLGLMKNFFW